jgi:hypothetical protein
MTHPAAAIGGRTAATWKLSTLWRGDGCVTLYIMRAGVGSVSGFALKNGDSCGGEVV